MSIALYKPGNAHIVRGVRCEYKICEGHSLKQHLKDGWFLSPEDCYLEPEEVVEEPVPYEPESTETEKKTAVREAAKEAGISNWYNKSIERLVEELETIKEL